MNNIEEKEAEILPFIRKPCPELNEEELKKTNQRFKDYVDLVI
jgi:hypothetical protein